MLGHLSNLFFFLLIHAPSAGPPAAVPADTRRRDTCSPETPHSKILFSPQSELIYYIICDGNNVLK